ncbi:MAG: WYL domain-containing protein [Promicromonosporaceae bacterium]|nr:WYL domain-containing protein [Promicromonosporaceae bacterium]
MNDVPRTPPQERLLNLVIALINTRVPLHNRQIQRQVAGYDADASPEVFGRMFERDKELLRELGVPIEVDDEGGYRIDVSQYALPPVDLTADELELLWLASSIWNDSVLREETGRGLTKLLAATDTRRDGADAGWLSPQLQQAGRAYVPLRAAIERAQVVEFAYRAARSGQTMVRRVQPWVLAVRSGGWYLIGHDEARAAARVFRLSRIAGEVRASGGPQAFVPPVHVDVDALLADPSEERTAELRVQAGRAAALRARASRTRGDVIWVDYRLPDGFADEVASLGSAVVVLGPPELRQAVLNRLRAAAALDGLPPAPRLAVANAR